MEVCAYKNFLHRAVLWEIILLCEKYSGDFIPRLLRFHAIVVSPYPLMYF